MLKVQIALIAILIVSVAFVSCERAQQMLDPVVDNMIAAEDTTAAEDMMMDMMKMIDSTMYMSWAHVALPAPTMTVAEAAAAGNAAGTGAAHNPGSDIFTSRTVYINDAGAMANKAGTAYPAGTIIVKEIMDATETFVDKVAVMMKSDDEMYAGHNGWVYAKYFLAEDGTWDLKAGSNVEGHGGMGCHNCHSGATNDKVFVSLSMDEMPEMPETPEMPDAGETPEMPEMPETPEGAGETPEMPETPETPEMPEADAGNGNGDGDTQ